MTPGIGVSCELPFRISKDFIGSKQGCPLSPTLFLIVMQAFLESLEKAMPADARLQFQTNMRTEGKNGSHVSGTDWSNKDEFPFGFWASLYAGDAATPLASRAALLAVRLGANQLEEFRFCHNPAPRSTDEPRDA